jgi:hypothetical protein
MFFLLLSQKIKPGGEVSGNVTVSATNVLEVSAVSVPDMRIDRQADGRISVLAQCQQSHLFSEL